jgi:hypothetical protein
MTVKHSEYNYDEFRDLVIKCAEEGSSTGHEITPERVEATKLNAQRMKRIDKQFQISEEMKKLLSSLSESYTWIVLAEAWCGDGAQIIPIIAKFSSFSTKIKFEVLLRDENPEVMNAYLTANSRSIPKVICKNANGEDVFVWGPRPETIAQMVRNYKNENPGVSHDEFVKNLHTWYAQDKGKAIEEDFIKLVKQLR